jgi:hypothetical protein
MKKRTFLITVILTNVMFVILLIHKRSTITGLMYKKQRYEQELHLLAKQENELTHELCNLQDRNTVKTYASTYLNMSPISIGQMQKLTAHG